MKLSYDEGQTWTVRKSVEHGWRAYSDIAVTKRGTVPCFYGRGTKPTFAGDALMLARFNLEGSHGRDSVDPHRETKP